VEDRDFLAVIEQIKSTEFQEKINSIRYAYHQGETSLGDSIKKELPAFTVSGIFKGGRKLEHLEQYNQLAHVDIDKLELEEVEQLREKINKCAYTFASFISPSGKGIKVFVRTNSSQENHKVMINQLMQYYTELAGVPCDQQCKDLARLCFLSHDEKAFVNENCETFKPFLPEEQKVAPIKVNQNSNKIDHCVEFTAKVSQYEKGNRNSYIYLLARNANRFGIEQIDIMEYCLHTFDLDKVEMDTAIKSAYVNNTQEFSKYQIKEERQTTLPTLSAKSMIQPLHELIERGKLAPPIPYLWTGIKEGSFGFVFGPSKSGKTTFCENLALAIANGEKEFFDKPLSCGAQKVFFISMEEYWQPRTERNARQIENLGTSKVSNFLTVNEDFPRIIDILKDKDWLKNMILESEAKVVFIDSLSRLYSGSIEESNLAKQVLLALRELSNDLKITLIVIHHTPKQIGRPLTIDSLAGSRMLAQDADFAIGVSRTHDGTRYLKEVAFRYAQENAETVTAFMINENSWLIPTVEVPEATLLKETDGRNDDSNAELIFDFIVENTQNQDTVRTKQLLEEFVDCKIMSKPTMFASLNKLMAKNKISKPHNGQYKPTQKLP
jgi:RecA-family ATPase